MCGVYLFYNLDRILRSLGEEGGRKREKEEERGGLVLILWTHLPLFLSKIQEIKSKKKGL